jgi:hypothetical protein
MRVVLEHEQVDSSDVCDVCDITQGCTFRMPTGHKMGNTLWMRTANRSRQEKRRDQVRTVSLVAGAVAYLDHEVQVVPVDGDFVVAVGGWGRG